MSRRRGVTELNNLNVSLHSIISGNVLDESVNIPFADEETPQVVRKANAKNDSTSSNESIPEKVSFSNKRPSLVDRKNANLRLHIDKNTNGDEASGESDTDDGRLESEKRDKHGPLPSEKRGSPELPARGLRRNSISMPVLNEIDLDALRALHMQATTIDTEPSEHGDSKESLNKITVVDDAESMICSITEPESEKEEIEPMIHHKHRSTFRTKRRHSIAPLPAILLNDGEVMVNSEYDAQSIASAAPSITSISSLASLLKEKMQAIPSLIRKRKKPRDYKIRAFVAILFLIIVFLVGYAYIMYNQKVMSRLYFEHIKFTSSLRLLHVFDSKGNDVLSGKLGAEITIDKPYHCKDNPRDGSVCWEWTDLARLYIKLDDKFTGSSDDGTPGSRCYDFRWESLDVNFNPIDCFNVGEERGQWYGGGLTHDSDWQLERASFGFAPFVTGDIRHHQWGNALKRYFLNSHGVAIEVAETTPLHISINKEYETQFCLKAEHDSFSFVNRPTPLPELKYRICTADDMKILHHNLTQKNLWDGLKEQDINVIKTMFDEPVWQIPENLTDITISNYTDKVIALSYFRLGHVLINEYWQQHLGDYELDESRFKSLDDTINVLHRRGFRISMTIQPFVSTESKTFSELVKKKLLIYERSTQRTIPALTKFGNAASSGVLDPTNNDTIPWLIQKLDKTVKKYQIDSFYLEFGTAFDMPRFYECARPLLNPDHYKTIFTNGVSAALNLLGVSGSISVPRPPAFLSLPRVNSSWEGLQTVVTSVLNYGIIGYPFIMPGPVGGDFLTEQNGTIFQVDNVQLPDKELYIRWLQLATFLPVLRFTHLPSDYKDDAVTEIAKELASVRQKTVTPILKKYLSDAMNEGLPLVRPLWMLDPHDAACLNVVDEFSIGDFIIVAPIMQQGKTIREVYLPQGVWKDGVDGSMRKGSRWIHNYRVPEDKIAYFVKMPDNTRF